MSTSSKSHKAKVVILVLFGLSVAAFLHWHGSHSQLVDFGFRTATLCYFIGIIAYAAGGKIKAYFKGRTEGIARELSELEEAKLKASKTLKDVEKRIIDLDKERQAILADYKAQGEAIKSEIIIKAEKSARLIVSQAKLTAQHEVDRAISEMRTQLSEEIIAATEKLLQKRLTAEEHQKLIDKSLSKVVLN